MYKGRFISVIIAAAGSGNRMDPGKINKQYRILGSKPILSHGIKVFEENPYIDEILVVVKEEDVSFCKDQVIDPYGFHKVTQIIRGGQERQDSVYEALKKVNEMSSIILIHDGARPFIEDEQINALIHCLEVEKAATVGVAVKDTVKMIKEDEIVSTLDRTKLKAIQTPQGFRKSIIIQAYDKAYKEGFYGTDDTVLVERLGVTVKVIDGTYRNIKITTEEDMIIANAFNKDKKEDVKMRVGTGFDAHALIKGRKLILGGIEIPHSTGLLGHSDADVLVHAIMDALLGACGLGDIGKHFPDTDEKYKGISSIRLLEKVRQLLAVQGYQINNIDTVVMAQEPKLSPYIEGMRKNIGRALEIDIKDVGIKATTTEGLGFVGREEGISAQASVSVY